MKRFLCFLAAFVLGGFFIATANDTLSTDTVLSERLDLIFGNKANKKYLDRLREVHRLPRNMSEDSLDAIYAFLRSKRVSDDVLPNLEFNAIKNEIVIVLMEQNSYPEKLSAQLIAMYKDKNMDYTWRDYCIQFIGQWYPKEKDEQLKKAMRVTLNEAVKDHRADIAGTALIALNGLKKQSGFDPAEITTEAYSLLTDKDTSNAIKVTSLQVGAELGDKRFLDLAKNFLKDSDDAQLKMSSLAAIGMLGGRDEIKLLEKYAEGADVRLRFAAKPALKKVLQRQ